LSIRVFTYSLEYCHTWLIERRAARRLRLNLRYTGGGMPVYEFSCNACGARVSIFVRSMSSPVIEVCDRCGATDLQRLVSRVAILRSRAAVTGLDDDSLLDGLDYNDPSAVARWTRSLHEEMGDELSPEMNEALERLERGEGSLDDLLPSEHDHGSDLGGEGSFDD
jgi:putative FmdB family regulatory protein